MNELIELTEQKIKEYEYLWKISYSLNQVDNMEFYNALLIRLRESLEILNP